MYDKEEGGLPSWADCLQQFEWVRRRRAVYLLGQIACSTLSG